jgi:hypothetical protein
MIGFSRPVSNNGLCCLYAFAKIAFVFNQRDSKSSGNVFIIPVRVFCPRMILCHIFCVSDAEAKILRCRHLKNTAKYRQ